MLINLSTSNFDYLSRLNKRKENCGIERLFLYEDYCDLRYRKQDGLECRRWSRINVGIHDSYGVGIFCPRGREVLKLDPFPFPTPYRIFIY